MQLRDLIAELDFIELHGPATTEVSGISYDARRVLSGDLYFALNRDGDDEIELALERGAAAVVSHRAGLRQRATRVHVADTRVALAEASAAFYGNAGERLHVIGITGGRDAWKTAHLTKQILERAGLKTGLISTLRHEIGDRTLPSVHFAEVSDIQRLFAAMVRAGCVACVLELPAISPASLKAVPVNVLVHEGGEQNLRALSLFVQNRQSAPVCGIVNIDAEDGRAVANSSAFKMQLTFGFDPSAEVSASEVSLSASGSQFLLNLAGTCADCQLPLVGRENIRHLLGASAASLSTLTPRQVLTALRTVQSPPCSLEPLPNEHRFSVFIDDARTEESLKATLKTVAQFRTARILLAFGSAERTSGKERYDMGRAAGQLADHIILTSDNPGMENEEQICGIIAQGIDSVGRSTYHIVHDRAQAIRELIGMAEPGDIILIAGKGERTFQVIGNTIVPFNDREIAGEALENHITPKARRSAEVPTCAA